MECNCKECLYYDEINNMCDGYTYRCECLEAFCPMFETEAMIKKRKLSMNNCSVLNKAVKVEGK